MTLYRVDGRAAPFAAQPAPGRPRAMSAGHHASLVTAMIMPISTNTTIAVCIQIQTGDTIAYSTTIRRPAFALMLSLAIALVASLAWAGLAAGRPRAAASVRTPSTSLLAGVNITGLSGDPYLLGIDRAVASAHELHAKVLRTGVSWAAVEPLNGTQVDAEALTGIDRLLADAESSGMRVVLTVDATPCWASSAPAPLLHACVPGQPSGANAWPPRNPSTYAAFVAYLAQRYGRSLAAIEIWNEPDQSNEFYFAGPEKAERYTAIVRAAYPAIKQANPNVLVLAGSIVGSNGAFLRALYAAGIKGYYDGLAVHFYTLTLAAVRSIHEVQLANGDNTPLWLDEFGWSSCYPSQKIEQEQACVTAQVQAANLTNTIRALARAPYVAAAIAYKMQDSPGEQFGLLSASGARKPAFAALARALASPLGNISPVMLSLRRRGRHVVASGSAPVGDYLELEAFKGSLLRYRAFLVLNRFNRFSVALPSALGTHGLRVRVFQYWSGVNKDAQKSI